MNKPDPGVRSVISRVLRPGYDTGASVPKRIAWYFVNLAVLYNPFIPLTAPRAWVLRAFGARVGERTSIKPMVRVKFPWRLTIGDGAHIGEDVWIDNLDDVSIGNGAMVSQGAYLCTGNHDWSTHELKLRTAPIRVGDQAWVGARVLVGPGAEIGDGTVVTAGSVAFGKLPPNTVCSGNPATVRRPRFP